MPGKSRKNKLLFGTTKVAHRKGRKAAVKLMATIAKNEIAKSLENKYACINALGDHSAPFNPAVGGANVGGGYIKQTILLNTDFYPILPKIAIGTDTFQRVGTSLRPKSLKIQMNFALTDAGSDDLSVRLFVLNIKQCKSYDTLATTTQNFATSLLWNGEDGKSTGFIGGEPYWQMLPLNNRVFTKILDKRINLRRGQGKVRQSNVNVGAQTFVGTEAYKTITFNIPLPASFRYDGTTNNNWPTNFAPVMCCGYTQADGYMSEDPQYNLNLIVMNYKASLSYEDA